MKQRLIAIGDIHGCLKALDTLLEMVAPESGDRLVFLGDYGDRGPDTRGVIDRLLAIRAKHQAVFLMGNHDALMLSVRSDAHDLMAWLSFGGDKTLESYRPPKEGLDLKHVPDSHWAFLQSCADFHETDSHIFVHGAVEPHLPLARQDSEHLLWQKLQKPQPHISGKTVVCGHTAQKSGLPLDLGHTVCIDTYVYGSGSLTALDVDAGSIWQASQTGIRRILHRSQLAASSAR
ncbi:MAG: serine/threonine protein phosphatase [Planctomycetes bacterium]|nr:serine/threonine protein phosphatase [Planctomycetota bacterium]